MSKILICCFALLSTVSFGQKKIEAKKISGTQAGGKRPPEWGVKIYQNSDFFSVESNVFSGGQTSRSAYTRFNRLSLAVTVRTSKGYTHEIEFFIPQLSGSMSQNQSPLIYQYQNLYPRSTNRLNSYAFRYEVNVDITKTQSKLRFKMGVGINPYFSYERNAPTAQSQTFPASITQYGAVFNIIPRVTYTISQRFIVDLNVPLYVYDFRKEVAYVGNPDIPYAHQKSYDNNSVFFEALTIRAGILYRLGVK